MKYSDDPISVGIQLIEAYWPQMLITLVVVSICVWLCKKIKKAFELHQAKKAQFFDYDLR